MAMLSTSFYVCIHSLNDSISGVLTAGLMMDPGVFYPYAEQADDTANLPTNQGGGGAGVLGQSGDEHTNKIHIENQDN